MAITFHSQQTQSNYAPNASSNPLSLLYTNPYATSTLSYPADLGHTNKGHIVVFTAYKTEPTSLLSSAFNALGASISALGGFASGSVSGVTDIMQKVQLQFQPKRSTPGDVISLYMPDTINFTYESSYSDVSLKDALNDTAASGAVSAVDTNAAALGMNTAGYAINPQQQLLFDGIEFRSYQLAFQMTPKNRAESDTIKKIIMAFRKNAAPKIQAGNGGMAFIVPNTFILQFIQKDNGENQYITKVKESVLTSVDVNYSPNGIWSAHADGSPTQINLTLQFKEIALIDQTAIEHGF